MVPPTPNFNVATNPELGRSCQAKLATQKKQNASKQSGLGASVHETLKFGVWGGADNHFFVFFCPDYFSRVGTRFFKKKKCSISHRCFYISFPDYFSRLRTPHRHAEGALAPPLRQQGKRPLETRVHSMLALTCRDVPSGHQPTILDIINTNAVHAAAHCFAK